MPSAVRAAVTGLVAASTMLVAACGGVDSANAAGVAHDDPVSELATQLAAVSTLSYTATYQLAGGDQGQIVQAQKPVRVAYSFPGGRLIRTTTGTIRCEGDARAPTCTETAPEGAAPPSAGPLITPEAVLAMLNVAATDPGVAAKEHDTTIAGHHAVCLALTGVSRATAADFSVCVTAEGALGSFAGTVDGKRVDLALTAYSDKPDFSAFELPATARLTDRRR